MSIIKKTLITLLGLSNVLVLSLVLNSYFGTQQKVFLFSLAEDLEDLKSKIQEDCAQDFSALLKGDKRSFICQVHLDQSHKGVSYKFKAGFKVSQQGDSYRITEIKGSFRNKKEHITEAHFCNDCFKEQDWESSSDEEALMDTVSDLAEEMYLEAKESVESAYDEEQKWDREKRIALIKERECEGLWDEESGSFVAFTRAEEALQCRLSQIQAMDNLMEIEQFYHEKVKKHLWHVALSEEEKASLQAEIFDSFHSPFRYSLSVRSSMALLENYTRWKEDFDILESRRDKELFLREITKDVQSLMSFMGQEQSQQDLYYLNQGFEGLYKKLQDLNRPSVPSIDYEAVSEEVENFY